MAIANWEIELSEHFEHWYRQQRDEVRVEILAVMMVLAERGPLCSRPYVDTLIGSKYPNMKELRVQVGGDAYRCAFAFDPNRKAIILCAAKKGSKRFYKDLIASADQIYAEHLKSS